MRRNIPSTLVVVIVMAAAGPLALAQTRPANEAETIATLIRQLGNDRWKVREAASAKLAEIGRPALPALRKAMLSEDLEVSIRAKSIVQKTLGALSKQVQERRVKMHQAFSAGDYEQMIRHGRWLVDGEGSDLLDFLWLAHAHQLGGDWPAAVKGYQVVVEKITGELKSPTPEQTAKLAENLIRQRAGVLLAIARLQRHKLNDIDAAIATLTAADELIASAKPESPIGAFRFLYLHELAACYEHAGRLAQALATWGKVHQVNEQRITWLRGPEGYDVSAVIRLLGTFPADRPVPQIPGVIVLTPKSPKIVLSLNQAQTRSLAYRLAIRTHRNAIRCFALVPSPGVEFKSIKVECDYELLTTGGRDAFAYVRARAFEGSWPKRALARMSCATNAPPGRHIVGQEFELAPGCGPVFIKAGMYDDNIIHAIIVTASFCPRRQPDPEFMPGVQVWPDLLPQGGEFTCDGKPISTRMDDLKGLIAPGRHVLEYAVPGRDEKLRWQVDMVRGGLYVVFGNLDGPFRSVFTNLRRIGDRNRLEIRSRTSLVQLPDGRWLLAYWGRDEKIWLAQSKDLVKWDAPRPMPHNSVFASFSPTLHVGPDGTIWLAWFSNCLHVESASHKEGFRLWLAHSRDGVKWSRSRPILIGEAGRWPPDSAHILVDAKGRHWMFYRGLGGCAETLDKIRELAPLKMPGLKDLRVRNTHVACDDEGRMHMIFNTPDRRHIHYSASPDGNQWSRPVRLANMAGGVISKGQLILDKGRACILYDRSGRGFVRGVTLGASPSAGPAIKVGHWLAQLGGAGLHRTKDGQVLLVGGGDVGVLMRAKLSDLMKLPAGAPPTTAPAADKPQMQPARR